MNDNAYRLDLSSEYRVNSTFNICDLSLFAGATNHEDDLDMKTNPSQKERFDGGPPHIRSLMRYTLKRIEENTLKKKTLLL